MQQLLGENTPFTWENSQRKAFERVKDILISNQSEALRYFDPSKPITFQVDASQHGLGAAVLQDGRPKAYALKALMQSEGNYAQIEKELFAILFWLLKISSWNVTTIPLYSYLKNLYIHLLPVYKRCYSI